MPSSPPNEAASEEKKDSDPIVSTPPDTPAYLNGWQLFIVMLALLLSMFLVRWSAVFPSNPELISIPWSGCLGYGKLTRLTCCLLNTLIV